MLGNGDFLEKRSPRISAHPQQVLGFIALGKRVGELFMWT
jgi:hypothetical protein